MRLNQKEITCLMRAVSSVLNSDCPYELFLFGSRADDSKKGGDIDLLIVVENDAFDKAVSLKTRIKQAAFEELDEQRIDITIATPGSMKSDPFLKSIAPSLILLDKQK